MNKTMKITTQKEGAKGDPTACKIDAEIEEAFKIVFSNGVEAILYNSLFKDDEYPMRVSPINQKDFIPKVENEEVKVL